MELAVRTSLLLAPRRRAAGADAAGVRNEPRDRIRPAPSGAEQVEKVDPNLMARDEDGKPYAVRYEAMNAMLLNEFLKEHWQVTAQHDGSSTAQQIEQLTVALTTQALQIEQRSAKVEASYSGTRLIVEK